MKECSTRSRNPLKCFSFWLLLSVFLSMVSISALAQIRSIGSSNILLKRGDQNQLSFTYQPNYPEAGKAVRFTDSLKAQATYWEWDFGDGTPSTAQNPSHSYATETSYNVSLTVSNSTGSKSVSQAIIVGSGDGSTGTYWVSPTGAATWANAKSATPLSGAACCSLSTANANAQAGDTVILRGGTYTLGAYIAGISPAHSGTDINHRITFTTYSSEVPVLTGDGTNESGWAIYLSGASWIRVTGGITVHNCARWLTLTNASCYNEIDHNVFYSDTGNDVVQAVKICGAYQGYDRTHYSCHNWIHHNLIHDAHRSAGDPTQSYEGRDLFNIGDAYNDAYTDAYMNNNNTVENNVIYHGGHTCFDSQGMYTVVKNNIMHNEPWYYEPSESDSPLPAYSNHYHSNAAWVDYYAHRCFGISNDIARPAVYDLVEGNRFGFGSTNPNNNGYDGCDLMGPCIIVRHNDIFGNMNSGLMFKYGYSVRGHGGTYCKVYNNTLYHNGYGNPWLESMHLDRNSTSPEALLAIRFYAPDSTGNVIKNNLVYMSRRYELSGFEIGGGASDNTIPAGNTVENNWWTANGDPKFTNPDLTNAMSTTLPDLTLQGTSGAIGQGEHLTTAIGAGAGSTSLAVADAMYFQDGTWGSVLAQGVTMFPDWIAIGTVGKIVQISSINYSTNTIMLASPMTWSNGDHIWLYKNSSGVRVLYGMAPDMGAHPVIR